VSTSNECRSTADLPDLVVCVEISVLDQDDVADVDQCKEIVDIVGVLVFVADVDIGSTDLRGVVP